MDKKILKEANSRALSNFCVYFIVGYLLDWMFVNTEVSISKTCIYAAFFALGTHAGFTLSALVPEMEDIDVLLIFAAFLGGICCLIGSIILNNGNIENWLSCVILTSFSFLWSFVAEALKCFNNRDND